MPRPTRDLTGQKFGRVTAIKRIDEPGQSKWICVCDCGKKIVAASNNLLRGNTNSCGCYQRERTSKAKRIHGERKTRLYTIWVDMRARCSRKSEPSYKNYGERGISVCKEWNDSFLKFKEWAIENGYSEDLTIDRIDVNGNYCPENCRWATAKEQANNKRTNLYITINGTTHTATEWCEINGIKYSTAMRRRQRGWPLEKAVSFRGGRRKKGGAGNL